MANIDIFAATPDQAASAQRLFNGQNREIVGIPEIMQEMSDKQQVYLANVGPWGHSKPCGTLGIKWIAACPEGKEYSEPMVIPGLVIETYPLREGVMDPLMHKNATGAKVAQEIIGLGRGNSPTNRLDKYGVFWSPVWPPKKETIKAAQDKLRVHLRDLVNEARQAAALGQKEADETIRPEHHIRAAQMLNLDPAIETWMRGAISNTARVKCEGCGTPYEVGLMICKECNFILDTEKYAKNKDRFVK